MRKSFFFFIILFLLFVLVSNLARADFIVPFPSKVEGVVKDSLTQEPIAGAEIYLLFEIENWEDVLNCDPFTCLQVGDKYYSILANTFSDSEGHFSLEFQGDIEVSFLVRKSEYKDYFEPNLYLPAGQTVIRNVFLESAIPEWRRNIQVGDILYDPYSIIGFGHVGIYIGDGYVIEAQGDLKNKEESKVKQNPITSWDYPKRKSVILLRVNISEEIKRKAVDFAMNQLDKNYDFYWLQKNPDPDAPSWYCSELVWAAYYNQGVNIDYLDEVLHFTDNPDFEDAYFRQPIPPKYIYLDSDTYEVSRHMEEESPPAKKLFFYILSPVDVIVKDGEGNSISTFDTEATSFGYHTKELMENGEVADKLVILEPRDEYFVEIWPDPKAKAGEDFTIYVEYAGKREVLFENEPIENLQPTQIKIQTKEEEIEIQEQKPLLGEKRGEAKIFGNKIQMGSLRVGLKRFLRRMLFLFEGRKISQKIEVTKRGSLDFKFNLRFSDFKGELCDKINLKVQNKGKLVYEGKLKDFSLSNLDFPKDKNLKFQYYLLETGKNSKRNRFWLKPQYCKADLVIEAWQKNFEEFKKRGFWDRKEYKMFFIKPLFRFKPPIPIPPPKPLK